MATHPCSPPSTGTARATSAIGTRHAVSDASIEQTHILAQQHLRRRSAPACQAAFKCELAAAQSEDGELLPLRRVRADASPLTAFDISRQGSFLGVGTSEGAAIQPTPSPAVMHITCNCDGHLIRIAVKAGRGSHEGAAW